MTKQSHFVFHHCQNTMCDTTAGCQRSSQRSQIVLNSRERHLHRRAIILEILEPFLRQQVQLCVFAGLSVLQRARAVRVAWPQLIVSRTPPMALTAALPAEQRGAAQRHEVHLTRASRTHRRKEHLVISLTQKLEPLCSFVHENSIQVSCFHRADLYGLLSPAHDLVRADISH